jgi:hypothetical protein
MGSGNAKCGNENVKYEDILYEKLDHQKKQIYLINLKRYMLMIILMRYTFIKKFLQNTMLYILHHHLQFILIVNQK